MQDFFHQQYQYSRICLRIQKATFWDDIGTTTIWVFASCKWLLEKKNYAAGIKACVERSYQMLYIYVLYDVSLVLQIPC